MHPFEFQWPTKMTFGPGMRHNVGRIVREQVKSALVVCAKGPFRELGVVGDVVVSLEKAGVRTVQMDRDVDQNPRLSTVRDGVRLCKREKIECVVAIGGGSAMDCSKLIAAASLYDIDPYEFVWGSRPKIERSLMTVMLPTIAATGTETNPSAVIVNDETKEKFYCDCMPPTWTIFDPELTASAPIRLVLWGAMDILSHTFEYYLNGVTDCEIQSCISEAILTGTMRALEKLAADPDDLAARGELQWCAALAWGGPAKIGRGEPEMTCHWIEESFSGYFDTHHGACLGVLTPRWMRMVCGARPDVLGRFARNVMGVSDRDDTAAAKEGVERYIEWLASIHAPDTFFDIGNRDFSDSELKHVAETAWRIYGGHIGRLKAFTCGDCLALLKSGRDPLAPKKG